MLAVLLIVLPVFIIVAAGYAANRSKLFPDSGVDGLMTFTAKFAVPCLLFNAMYGLHRGNAPRHRAERLVLNTQRMVGQYSAKAYLA